MLYDLLDQQIEGGLPVTLAQVQGFFRESTAPEFLSAKAAEVISSVCTGGLSAAVSNSELMTLVEENRALIEKHFSCTMDEVAMTALSDWLEQNRAAEVMTEKIQGTLLNGTAQPGGDIDAPGSNAMATVSTAMGIVRKLTAAAPLLIAGALCAVLTGLLFLSCWGRPHSALLAGGWTYLAAGILFLLPCACAPVLRSLLPGGVGAAAGNALALTWPTGTAAAVLGIAMIAGGFLLKARKKAPVPQTNE